MKEKKLQECSNVTIYGCISCARYYGIPNKDACDGAYRNPRPGFEKFCYAHIRDKGWFTKDDISAEEAADAEKEMEAKKEEDMLKILLDEKKCAEN